MTPLTKAESDFLLDTRIPDRLFELLLCSALIELLQRKQKLSCEIHANEQVCNVVPSRVLLHASLDAGIMTCRALLNFLGIWHGSSGLRSAAPPATDISIEHFSRPLLTVDQATGGSAPIGEALLLVLEAGNKGVGHLTVKPARIILKDLEKVRIACNRTKELIDEYLYDRLPKPSRKPKFIKGGYGHLSVTDRPGEKN
jgi:hypothetical protein